MAHLFQLDPNPNFTAWLVRVAEADGRFTLPGGVKIQNAGGAVSSGASGRSDDWFLLSSEESPVRVNGDAVVLGIRELQHRDEIVAGGGERFFFSTERPACIEAMPNLGRTVFCARCKQPCESGQLVVRCPACGAFHHQAPECGCWNYDVSCAMCQQQTELTGEFAWTPAKEGWS